MRKGRGRGSLVLVKRVDRVVGFEVGGGALRLLGE